MQPLGICDYCLQPINIDWYTSHGQPRQYCCRDCRNTANSRAGAAVRGEQTRERVRDGTWFNPSSVLTPEQLLEAAKLGGAASGAKFREQVNNGVWRNPALSEPARAKLSRPRTINDAVLHSAVSKLTQGLSVSDLTPDEAETYRAYRRRLKTKRTGPAR